MKSQNSRQNRVPDRVVICGSMAFYSEMVEMRKTLKRHGIIGVIPNQDSDIESLSRDIDYQNYKRRSAMRHIRRVRDKSTVAVLVMNIDKHGIRDYIGPNTFAEIAVAFAHYKPVFILQNIPDFYWDELTAWQVTPLNGRLVDLIKHYKTIENSKITQLTFDFF